MHFFSYFCSVPKPIKLERAAHKTSAARSFFLPMKHHGSCFPYKEQRKKELMTAFHSVISSTRHLNMMNVFREVVSRPCSRYWVTEERAAIVISSIERNTYRPLGKYKHEMYMNLYHHYVELRRIMPELSYQELIYRVVNSRAPKFYLSPSLAKIIINTIRYSKR